MAGDNEAGTVLVTGGQGFLGAWIARRLLRDGVRCVLLDLVRDDSILRQVLQPEEIAQLGRVEGDVSDTELVRRVVSEAGAARVIHLAGLQVPACREDPVAGARVNVIGTLSVLEAARKNIDVVRSVVYASSAAVAGPAEDYSGPIADDAAHRPRTHYGVFKAANEGSARVAFEDHGVPSVGLRPLVVYGVGREVGLTSGPTKAIRAALAGEKFTVPFTGRTSFSYVEDVADIFVDASLRHREGALALNLPGEVADVEEFLDGIVDAIPSARGLLRCEGPPLPLAYDFRESGLANLLGTVPHTPIREGIRRTASRFRQNLGRGPERP